MGVVWTSPNFEVVGVSYGMAEHFGLNGITWYKSHQFLSDGRADIVVGD
jgi:hypothetical protein